MKESILFFEVRKRVILNCHCIVSNPRLLNFRNSNRAIPAHTLTVGYTNTNQSPSTELQQKTILMRPFCRFLIPLVIYFQRIRASQGSSQTKQYNDDEFRKSTIRRGVILQMKRFSEIIRTR